MFVPLNIIQNHKPLKNVKDCMKVLEEWVLKKYPNSTTSNIPYTKTECYGILYCFHQIGKLDPSLSLEEIEISVIKFMDEKLWVDPVDSLNVEISVQNHPASWYKEAKLIDFIIAFLNLNGRVTKDFILGNISLLSMINTYIVKTLKRLFTRERLTTLTRNSKIRATKTPSSIN
jgi:hypothetical protein